MFDQTTLADPLTTSTLAGTSDTGDAIIRAGSFIITQPGPNTARGIRWIGVYYGGSAPIQDNFTIAFHTDLPVENVPVLPAFASYSVGNVTRIPLGLINADGGLRDGYEYFAPIPDTLLSTGVTS